MSVATSSQIDLSKVVSEVFKVLTDKEQDVITKRFDLDAKGRRTLESIGQSYNVTRERIRQIESIALSKLRRTMKNTQIKEVNEMAQSTLEASGGLMLESDLVSAILNQIGRKSEVDGNIIKVALAVNKEVHEIFDRVRVKRCWAFEDVNKKLVQRIGDGAVTVLKKKQEALAPEQLASDVHTWLTGKKIDVSKELIRSALKVDTRLAEMDGRVGLAEDRTVRPRALRDKAYIILKREGKPMHFNEITNSIIEANFDNKAVRTPAVHNELIRGEHFVLVGRGLYGLKEWGREGGIVPDVLARVVKSASKPLSKEEIVALTQKEREVKKGTVVLGLQKHPQIKKNKDGLYEWVE